MKWIEAQYNITNGYNPDYAYEDDWKYLNWNFRILSKKEQPSLHGEISHIVRIKTSAKVQSKKVLYKVLYDYFVEGCSCSHDCCGHFFGGLYDLKRPTNRKNNEYIAKISYSRNY